MCTNKGKLLRVFAPSTISDLIKRRGEQITRSRLTEVRRTVCSTCWRPALSPDRAAAALCGRLCKDQWRYVSVYRRLRAGGADRSYRHTYLQLDEGTLTFNADPFSVRGVPR